MVFTFEAKRGVFVEKIAGFLDALVVRNDQPCHD
jgi:hypothetical protein